MCGSGFFTFGQEVNKEFTKLLLNEQFSQVEKNWSSTFNADNLFIAQNGYFELYRKSKKSGYFLFSNSTDEYSAFQLETAIVFNEHDNKKQSAGVLMMAQNESGGLLVEINQKREYRVVRVYKDKQVPLNGNGNGWRKAASAITKVENTILIKTYDKVYDLYINGSYLESFTDIELNKGKVGIFVGPDSKVKFDYLKILGEEKKDLQSIVPNEEKTKEESFTLIIVKLKDQINQKERELDEVKTKLKLCETSGGTGVRNSDTGLLNIKNTLSSRVNELEEENDELKFKLIGMETELEQLREFRKGVETSANGDIVISLTNIVASQTATINELEKKNKSLNEESNGLFIETKDLSKKLDVSTNQLTEAKTENLTLKSQLDSLKNLVLQLRDTIKMKASDTTAGAQMRPMTDEEKLQQMIEKEREERRKRKEEEERLRKEEEERNKKEGE